MATGGPKSASLGLGIPPLPILNMSSFFVLVSEAFFVEGNGEFIVVCSALRGMLGGVTY